MAYPYTNFEIVRVPWLVVRPVATGAAPIILRQGDLVITGLTRRRTTTWRTATPVGSLVPQRTLTGTPRPSVRINGTVMPGRFREGRALLGQLEDLLGAEATLEWKSGSNAGLDGRFVFDDVNVTERHGYGLLMGTDFTIDLTAAGDTVATTPTPRGGTPPAFTVPSTITMPRGQTYSLTVTATVPLGLPAAGGYYMAATGLPDGITLTAPNTISGTPAATAKEDGSISLSLLSPDGTTVATHSIAYTVTAG